MGVTMNLGRDFKLKQTKHGVELLHRTEGRNPKTEEATIKWVSSYHGTLYQALQKSLDLSIDPTKDYEYIMNDILTIMKLIDYNKEDLKKNFKTEVRTTK